MFDGKNALTSHGEVFVLNTITDFNAKKLLLHSYRLKVKLIIEHEGCRNRSGLLYKREREK